MDKNNERHRLPAIKSASKGKPACRSQKAKKIGVTQIKIQYGIPYCNTQQLCESVHLRLRTAKIAPVVQTQKIDDTLKN
jgi:hypothetical protein